jgi:hypothetical protein
MFDTSVFDKEIDGLLQEGLEKKAEERMLKAYSELRATDSAKELEYVACRLAHFYSAPDTEDLEKAEAFFLRCEELSPGAYAKAQTATFYFYVLADLQKTITKVNEITPSDADRASYYSALTLKGQALIKLDMLDDADAVLKELLKSIRTNPAGLPYGDEINLLEAVSRLPRFAAGCREVLELIVPKIRSEEYRVKANALLGQFEQ